MVKIAICVSNGHGWYREGDRHCGYEDRVDDPAIVHPQLGGFVKQWLADHHVSHQEYRQWERIGYLRNRTNPMLIQALEAEAQYLAEVGVSHQERINNYSNFAVVEFDETIFDAKLVYVSSSEWNNYEGLYELSKKEKLVLTPKCVKAHIASFVDANDLAGLLDYLNKTGYQALNGDTSAASDEYDESDDADFYYEYEDEYEEYMAAYVEEEEECDSEKYFVPTQADIYEEMYAHMYKIK